MATTTRSREIDPELMTSRMFAQVFQAYVECTEEIQSLIRDMAEIVNDTTATEDEKLMACSTIADALFPSRHDGHLGVDLEQAERLDPKELEKDVYEEITLIMCKSCRDRFVDEIRNPWEGPFRIRKDPDSLLH